MSEAERIAREWLESSREDLATAEVVLAAPSLSPRAAAWHAQQAVEKAIKALLVLDQIEFPFTHDLSALLVLLPEPLPSANRHELASLSRFAVEARYPGPWPVPERRDAEAALDAAREVVDDVGARIGPVR
jgi:HEPN domain-containing protein